jgi:hypothetical protein
MLRSTSQIQSRASPASQSDFAFAETLLAAIEPADFDLLGRLHYVISTVALIVRGQS